MPGGGPYTEFGDYMFWTAYRNKGVRGPYRVAKYMEREAKLRDYDLGIDLTSGKPIKLPKGGAVSKYFLGRSTPEPWWVNAFADSFDLDEDQRDGLADHYAYKSLIVRRK